MSQPLIQVSDSACQKLFDLVNEEKSSQDEQLYLRIAIMGGGCSGFQYDFEFCESIEEDDLTIENDINGQIITIIVDPISIQSLEGATLDYLTDMQGERFTISNPNAKSTCGCGNSFTLEEESKDTSKE
jgi:iron-sulfur cluster insertion protein|tara:strand:- start:4609 stop:4995 length:387 start_codon:yes stop_codon:yes gene_type:complete